MSEENAVVASDGNAVAVRGMNPLEAMMAAALTPQKFSHDVAEELQEENFFLPYARCIQGTSNKYKRPPFDFNDGDITLHRSKTEVSLIGREVDVIFLKWRPLAMRWNAAANTVETSEDFNSENFNNWKLLAEDPNPNVRRGYTWGYEFLAYFGDIDAFATVFFNNGSGRRFARFDLLGTKTREPLLGKTLTMFYEEIEDTKKATGETYFYWVPRYRLCNTDFKHLPNPEIIPEVVRTFDEGRSAAAETVTEEIGGSVQQAAATEDNPNR